MIALKRVRVSNRSRLGLVVVLVAAISGLSLSSAPMASANTRSTVTLDCQVSAGHIKAVIAYNVSPGHVIRAESLTAYFPANTGSGTDFDIYITKAPGGLKSVAHIIKPAEASATIVPYALNEAWTNTSTDNYGTSATSLIRLYAGSSAGATRTCYQDKVIS